MKLEPIYLNLGCGADIRSGYTNVDLYAAPGIDVVTDLDRPGWPWFDGQVHHILARHVFEHVENAPRFMAECWRVLRPGGTLDIVTPHWKSRDAYTDPTHRRFPTEYTFDYWVSGTMLNKHHGQAYRGVSFCYASQVSIMGGELHVNLVKTVE